MSGSPGTQGVDSTFLGGFRVLRIYFFIPEMSQTYSCRRWSQLRNVPTLGKMSENFNACVPVYWDTVRDRYPLELKHPAHNRQWIWVIQSTHASRGRISEFECIVRHECMVGYKVWHYVLDWKQLKSDDSDFTKSNSIPYNLASPSVAICPYFVCWHVCLRGTPPSDTVLHHRKILGRAKIMQYACFNVKVILEIYMASVDFNHPIHIKTCKLQSAYIRQAKRINKFVTCSINSLHWLMFNKSSSSQALRSRHFILEKSLSPLRIAGQAKNNQEIFSIIKKSIRYHTMTIGKAFRFTPYGFIETINAWFRIDSENPFLKSSFILPARLQTRSHVALVAGCARNWRAICPSLGNWIACLLHQQSESMSLFATCGMSLYSSNSFRNSTSGIVTLSVGFLPDSTAWRLAVLFICKLHDASFLRGGSATSFTSSLSISFQSLFHTTRTTDRISRLNFATLKRSWSGKLKSRS
jgi:hypothetical protein